MKPEERMYQAVTQVNVLSPEKDIVGEVDGFDLRRRQYR